MSGWCLLTKINLHISLFGTLVIIHLRVITIGWPIKNSDDLRRRKIMMLYADGRMTTEVPRQVLIVWAVNNGTLAEPHAKP